MRCPGTANGPWCVTVVRPGGCTTPAGVVITTAVEVPRPGRATQEEANLLGISVGDLLTRIERTYYDRDGRPVETADIVVPDVRWEIAYEIPIDRPDD